MPKAAKIKKISTKPSQGSLRESNPVKTIEKGARLPSVSFKNRSTGRGNEDRSKPCTKFTSNGIHTKSGVDNL